MRCSGQPRGGRQHLYLAGGADGGARRWRETTIDVDIALEPEQDEVLGRLPAINELR